MSNWTEEDYRSYLLRTGQIKPESTIRVRSDKGIKNKKRIMNTWEARYAAELDTYGKTIGMIDYKFNCIKLMLADGAWYTPDFMIMYSNKTEIIEIKGFRRTSAILRFKVAKSSYPMFDFRMLTWDKESQTFKEIG